MNRFLKFCIIAVAIAGCEIEKPPKITVENDWLLHQTIFANETKAESVTFTADGAWMSSIDPPEAASWINYSPKSGDEAGRYTISIELRQNGTGNSRMGIITISCDYTDIHIAIEQFPVKEDGTMFVAVEAIQLSQNSATVSVGETLTLTAIVMPENATYQDVVWASRFPNIATVVDGIVTPLVRGITEITATSIDGARRAICYITVNTHPVVTTIKPLVNGTNVTLGGDIISVGDPRFSERGVVYSTSENPTTDNAVKEVVAGSGTGEYTTYVTGLLDRTTYFARAYVVHTQGVAYGEEFSFTTMSGEWTRKADFPGVWRSDAVAFSIGNKGYIGMGRGSNYQQDFWEYDPATDRWTRKADFPGEVRTGAFAFSAGGKGYIGGGEGRIFNSAFQDFWEYDPATDTWTQKINLPQNLINAVGFSIGDKGYFGGGISVHLMHGTRNYSERFVEYDTVLDRFMGYIERIPVLPRFANRQEAVGFSIGDKGYVGTGHSGYGSSYHSYHTDFWEYDPATSSWTRKADFPEGEKRYSAVGFSIGGKGYVGTGGGIITVLRDDGLWQQQYHSFQDFWEYDPLTNTWSQKTDFQGGATSSAVGFSIGDRGYVLGSSRTFWEFEP